MFPGISFGASCPLSSVEKTLREAVDKLPEYKTEVFRGVLEQLRWFAGIQVKSVAVSPSSGALKAHGTRPFVTRRRAEGSSVTSTEDPAGLSCQCLELAGVLVKMQIPRPHSQRF